MTMKSKYTTDILINKFQIVHGQRYDYSSVVFTNIKHKVNVVCRIHGLYSVDIHAHLKGQNCKKCMYEGERKLPFALNTKLFIEKANKTHNHRYDYSLVKYETNKDVVKIICFEHGEFLQRPDRHMQGDGCIKCAGTYQYDKEEFVKKSVVIHGNKYDYSKSVYLNNDSKIEIICIKHGPFFQVAKDHVRGIGCKLCSESKGEKNISNILNSGHIIYERQKKFHDCCSLINNKKLPFDFYLPDYNLCIEYDGEQHYKPVIFKNMNQQQAEINFQRVKVNDQIKTNYCKTNGIELLRIPYTEFKRIDEILYKKLIW